MSKTDDLNKKKIMNQWRSRTGNVVFKGLFRDGKTIEAEKRMKRKPYGNAKKISVD